jgi:hypothetical protein
MKGIVVNDKVNDDSTATTPTNSMEVRKGNKKRATNTRLEGYITNM